jgi:hypothetical protein
MAKVPNATDLANTLRQELPGLALDLVHHAFYQAALPFRTASKVCLSH